MPFSYRAITANCGTSVIGPKAYDVIIKSLKEDQADFYVLNCQEIKFNKTLAELEEILKSSDYKITLLGKMGTYTKGPSMGEGMASYVIHKRDIKVDIQSTEAARRSNNPLSGTPYNKGGLVINAQLTRNSEILHLQTISGHLDSADIVQRAQDWLVIHHALAKPVSNWEQLVEVMPHLRLSGYDANTRNKIEESRPVNPWLSNTKSAYEIQGMQFAVFEDQRFSRESTYKTHLGNRLNREDPKRAGYTQGGTLDFVGIADGRDHLELDIESATIVSMDVATLRDHDVIMSPLQSYVTLSEFDKVKSQMASRLAKLAPLLAQEIKLLADTPRSRSQLVTVYQEFLSKGAGLLNKELELFKEKLRVMNKVTQMSLPPWFLDLTKKTLFHVSPSFELSDMSAYKIDEIKEQQTKMLDLLTKIRQSKNLDELCQCLDLNSNLKLSARANVARLHRSSQSTEKTDSEHSSISSLGDLQDSIEEVPEQSPSEYSPRLK